MPRRRLIVLKLGGSVLRSEADLPAAVLEVERHLREWERIVVVPSAFAGVTDALVELATRSGRDALATAALLASGELRSAARLTLALDRAGMEALTIHPASLGLRATGPALDAFPKSVDVDAVGRYLARHRVLVVPGFVAVDEEGRTCCLGRGGSDLSALFLAHALEAGGCRLIKDVDGLYEADPNAPQERVPRRYASLSWEDALRLDGAVVQQSGLEFAHNVGLSFEVGAVGSDEPTRVGAYGARFASSCRAGEEPS